jgi:hypothetical protein
MKLVLFDPRPESSTYGEICEIWLSESNRQLIHIPRFVWHADHNIGMQDAVVVNFATAVMKTQTNSGSQSTQISSLTGSMTGKVGEFIFAGAILTLDHPKRPLNSGL